VGDLIELKDKDVIPADCVLINTLNTKGEAYVSSTNLKGTLDLQVKKGHMFIKNNFPRIFCRDPEYVFKVEMNKHCRNLDTFEGRMTVEYDGPEVKRMKPFMGSCSIGFCLA
jgi:magnesium-transporting ATPase (P-type)